MICHVGDMKCCEHNKAPTEAFSPASDMTLCVARAPGYNTKAIMCECVPSPILAGQLLIREAEGKERATSVIILYMKSRVAMCVGMVMRPEMSPPFSIQKVEIVLRDVGVPFQWLKTTPRFSDTLIPTKNEI